MFVNFLTSLLFNFRDFIREIELLMESIYLEDSVKKINIYRLLKIIYKIYIYSVDSKIIVTIMEMLRNELMQIANASIEAGVSNVARLENLLKEQRMAGEKMQKEIGKLMLKRMNLQTDLDNANVEMDKLEKEVADKDKQLRNVKNELNR